MEKHDDLHSLEKRKLELEIKQLKKPYFWRVIFPIIIQIFATALVAVIGFIIAYNNTLTDAKEKNIDAKEKSIDTKIKNNETILKTIELTKKRDELDEETKELEARKKLVEDTTYKLTSQLKELSIQRDAMSQNLANSQKENKKLKDESIILSTKNKNYESDLSKLDDSLDKSPFLSILSYIDSLSNFNYDDFRSIYRQLEGRMRNGRNNNTSKVVEEYINNQDKPYVNRMNILAAAYHNLNNPSEWLAKYQNLVIDKACERQPPASFTKTITARIWNDSDYHLTIKSLLKNLPNESCRESLFSLVNRLVNSRRDDLLSPDEDHLTFLNYLSLYTDNVAQQKNLNSFSTKLSIISRLKYASSKTIRLYLSEYILLNRELFIQFINNQTELRNKNPRNPTNELKRNADFLKISEQEFVSIDYWDSLNKQNLQLIKRLLEASFASYRNSKKTLILDMNIN